MGAVLAVSLRALAQTSVPPAGILVVRHERDRGITTIAVATNALPPCARVNVFRSDAPITEANLIFCPKVASFAEDGTNCSIAVPDSGDFYYALTTADRYHRQDKSLLKATLVGPVTEVCRTPPPPPIPQLYCTHGRAQLRWLSQPGVDAAKYRIYRHQGGARAALGEMAPPEVSGRVAYSIPGTLAKDVDGLWTVTTVNSSGLESPESAPVRAAFLPDLEIAAGATIARNPDFSIGRMFPLAGRTVPMSVRVHNKGLVHARGVRVMVCAHHDASQTSSCLLDRLVDVAPDGSAGLEFDWTPEHPGEYHLKAVIDPFGHVAEIDKGNNQASVLVPVVRRDVFIAWYGNPLQTDWCNLPNARLRDLGEWKRRGAIAAFCGMVDGQDASYRQRIQAGFTGVAVDEIGQYDQGAAHFITWLTGLKKEHPDFFIALWMAAAPSAELISNAGIDLYIGENYYRMDTPPEAFDAHIHNARKCGILGKYIFGLGAGLEEANTMGHTHTVNEQAAFIEKEMVYIAEHAPEMPGIALYGSRPGLAKLLDDLCYRHFVAPQVERGGP